MSNNEAKYLTNKDSDAFFAHMMFMSSQTIALLELVRDLAKDRPDVLKRIEGFNALVLKIHEKHSSLRLVISIQTEQLLLIHSDY